MMVFEPALRRILDDLPRGAEILNVTFGQQAPAQRLHRLRREVGAWTR